MQTKSRRRSRRMELRTTPEERDLIDFVVTQACDAARRVLADRERFELDEAALIAWEALNARPARDLPGLRRLMRRASPFSE
jgi:uncharacterized protein (DUF1778 family)